MGNYIARLPLSWRGCVWDMQHGRKTLTKVSSGRATSQNQQRHAPKYATVFYFSCLAFAAKDVSHISQYTHKLGASCGNKLHLHYATLSSLTNELNESMLCAENMYKCASISYTTIAYFLEAVQNTRCTVGKIRENYSSQTKFIFRNYFIEFNIW